MTCTTACASNWRPSPTGWIFSATSLQEKGVTESSEAGRIGTLLHQAIQQTRGVARVCFARDPHTTRPHIFSVLRTSKLGLLTYLQESGCMERSDSREFPIIEIEFPFRAF